MLFTNLVGDKGVGTFKRSTKKNTIPFKNTVKDLYEEKRVVLRDGMLVTADGEESEDIFIQDMVGKSGKYLDKICPYTVEALADTEDNPMFAVLTDAVKFYEGIPTFIKYIHVEDGMFVLCLVYGACDFKCSDGTFIQMTRCLTNGVSSATTSVYNDDKLKEICSSQDSKSDYDMAYDMVNAVLVDIKNEYVCKYKTVKESEYIFSTEGRDERRSYLDNKRKEHEAAVAAKHEENRLFMEKLHEKQKAEAENKKKAVEEQYKAPKNMRLPKDKSSSKKSSPKEGSAGAKNFMEALRSMGYKH